MKIILLEAENIKKIKAVSISPTGPVVEITGKNRAGKSSVLDCIYWALAGKSAIQSDPIREGEDNAQIRLDLGDGKFPKYRVTRTFARKEGATFTTSVRVESPDGAVFKSPQTMIADWLGPMSFDPLEFARDDPKAQFDALKSFVLGFDFEASAALKAEQEERRRTANRRAKELRIMADKVDVPPGTPEEPIDEAALTDQLEAAILKNAETTSRLSKIATWQQEADAIEAGIPAALAPILRRAAERRAAILEQIERLKAELDQLQEQTDSELAKGRQEALAKVAELRQNAETARQQRTTPSDVGGLRLKLDEARRTNLAVQAAKTRASYEAQAAFQEAEAQALTQALADLEKAKQEAIAAANMPVEGLSFGDGVVLLNGHPFDQASSAEQLRASVAIAMASNPELRVLRIRDGALLDDESMAILEEMLAGTDYQAFVETVESDRPGAIVIEDGSVKMEAAA